MNTSIKESTYFFTWLIITIGSAIGGFILGGVFGFIIGFILGSMGVDINAIVATTSVIGFIMGALVSYLLFRWLVAVMIVKKVEEAFHVRNQ